MRGTRRALTSRRQYFRFRRDAGSQAPCGNPRQYAAPVAITVLNSIRQAYPVAAYPSTRIRDLLLQFLLDWNVPIIGLLGLSIVASKATQDWLNKADITRLKNMVDSLHAAYFVGISEGERYHNRVTLFRANRKRVSLEAVCRSGTQFPRGIQSLGISDDAEAANEGVAGWAWFTDSTVTRTNLPDCPVPCVADDPQCQEYARAGLMPPDKARKLHVRSRSLLATPVRDRAGNRWGVLVLDSRRPDAIDAERGAIVTSMAAAIGHTVV